MPDSAPSPAPPSERRPAIPWVENAAIVAIAILLALLLRLFVIEPRFIPSESMIPTLQVRDRLIVDKLSYRFHPPQRGDIVVFHPPPASGVPFDQAYIKRIIGLPGDRLAIHDGAVYVNGAPLTEPYVAEPPAYTLPQRGWELEVPPHQYWVMGDNRNNSNDSHAWGFLPEENLIGRAFFRFWPLDRRLGWLRTPR